MTETITANAPQGTPVPDLGDRVTSLVAHADDNMVMAQRLGEWISNAPDLELDIALGNIALDHLGVARALYTHAGEIERKGRTEDDFAMRRSEREFLNILLVEQPNGDFAHTIVRQVFFDVYQQLLWAALADSGDDTLAGIAGRAAKETAYHNEFSRSWLERLGGGTVESHRRAQGAVDALWRYTSEITSDEWMRVITRVLNESGLVVPDDPYQRSGGRQGYHTEHLGYLLAEMQWMDRAHPGMTW